MMQNYKLIINNTTEALLSKLRASREKKYVLGSIHENLDVLCELGWIKGKTRKLREDIWELKISTIRLLYTVRNGKIYVLDGYIKSTSQTPKSILRSAHQRCISYSGN